jgi:hypothetical protein
VDVLELVAYCFVCVSMEFGLCLGAGAGSERSGFMLGWVGGEGAGAGAGVCSDICVVRSDVSVLLAVRR